MKDSHCTRAGADDTGRYRVPAHDSLRKLGVRPLTHCPGCDPVRYPLEQQLAWFDEYADRAFDVLFLRLFERREELRDLARSRGIAGFATYGDDLCHKPEVLPDLDEELGDAVWYATEYLRRQRR